MPRFSLGKKTTTCISILCKGAANNVMKCEHFYANMNDFEKKAILQVTSYACACLIRFGI